MEKIGFIGLGIMGKPMAINLLKSGYEVRILATSKAADDVAAHGAITVSSPSEVAAESDIIVTMLPDSPEVQAVVNGPSGILPSMKQDALFIDMSTISPAVSRQIYDTLQEAGIQALDAPVSGGQVGAQSGSLSIMVGGDESAFHRAYPLFEVLGKNIVRIGGPGAGQTTKACNQLIVGVTIQAVAEALALAEHSGVDTDKMREVLLGGFAQSRILDLHGQRIIDKNFQPGFKIKLHRKDMGIVLAAGQQLGVPLLSAQLVAEQMQKALEVDRGELDHSALYLMI